MLFSEVSLKITIVIIFPSNKSLWKNFMPTLSHQNVTSKGARATSLPIPWCGLPCLLHTMTSAEYTTGDSSAYGCLCDFNLRIYLLSKVKWCSSVIPALWHAEFGGSDIRGRPGKFNSFKKLLKMCSSPKAIIQFTSTANKKVQEEKEEILFMQLNLRSLKHFVFI